MELTISQKAAIEHRPTEPVIISAGAGSGKTFVLEHHIAQVLSNKEAKIEDFAILTFTDAAAEQLKNRIKISANLTDEDMCNSKISTIHSFYKDFIVENIQHSPLSSGFSSIGSGQELLERTLDDTITAFYHDYDTESREDLFLKFGFSDDEPLRELIKKYHNFLNNIPFGIKNLKKRILNLNVANIQNKRTLSDFRPFLETHKSDDTNRNLEFLTKNFNESEEYIYKTIVFFETLTCDFAERFSKAKLSRNVVDFSDLENFALEISEITKSNKTQEYFEIIVDEFQDSNEIQYLFFKNISNNTRNLFLVGDMKQSIYRFRNAEPDVFSRLTAGADGFKTIFLSENFRSYPEIIDFTNTIFCEEMTLSHGGTNYKENQALICSKPDKKNPIFETEFIEIDKELTKNFQQVDYISLKIKSMVENKFPLRSKNNEPATFGDFAVLANKFSSGEDNGFIHEISRSFKKFGIPFKNSKEDFFSNYSIKSYIKLLKVIENPYNDFLCAEVLLSDLYKIDIKSIISARNCPNNSLFLQLIKYAKTASDPIIRTFIKEINHFRALFQSESPIRSISEIMSEKSDIYVRFLQNYKGDIAVIYNLRILREICIEYFAQNPMFNLKNIINYLQKNTEKIKGFSSEGEDCVKVFTIHSSKGLEFPIVFLANAHKDPFNANTNLTKEIKDDIIINKNYGITIRHILKKAKYETLPHYASSEILKNDSISENLRLLYVALTRPKEKLFIISDKQKYAEHSYSNIISKYFSPKEFNFENYTKLVSEISGFSEISEKKDVTKTAKFVFVPEISLKNYPQKKLTTVPAKISATEAGVQTIFKDTDIDIFPRKPLFFKENKNEFLSSKVYNIDMINILYKNNKEILELSPKQRGDAFHTAVKYLNFNSFKFEKIPLNSKKTIDILYENLELIRDKFTILEYKTVIQEAEKIAVFLDSKLGKRVINSKKIYKEYPVYTFANLDEFLPDNEIQAYNFKERPFIQGICDLFFVENIPNLIDKNPKYPENMLKTIESRIILIDYKTGGKSATQLAEKYRGQLQIYSRAINEIFTEFGISVSEKYIWSFDLNEAIPV